MISSIYDFIENIIKFIKPQVFEKVALITSFCITGILILVSLTNYSAISNETIIIKNTLNKRVYSYEDIKEVKVGITEGKDINLYYKIVLNDGQIYNITNGAMITEDNTEPYEMVLLRLDKMLANRGIKKVKDIKNIGMIYEQGYDKEYVDNVVKVIKQ